MRRSDLPGMRRSILGASIVTLALGGCATPDRRFASAVGYNDRPTDTLTVRADLSASAAPAASKTKLKDLPERAAAAYIAALAAKTKTAAELQSALSKPIGADAAIGADATALP